MSDDEFEDEPELDEEDLDEDVIAEDFDDELPRRRPRRRHRRRGGRRRRAGPVGRAWSSRSVDPVVEEPRKRTTTMSSTSTRSSTPTTSRRRSTSCCASARRGRPRGRRGRRRARRARRGRHQDRAPPGERVPLPELLPRAPSAPARRRDPHDLPRLRVNRSTAARLGAAAVTGALLAAARPPLDLGPLACVAFVPLFVAWRGQRRARRPPAYAFVAAAVVLRAAHVVVVVLRHDRDRAAGRRARRVLGGGGRGARVARAAAASPTRSSPPRCGCWPKRPSPALPLGGFSWGEVGYAFHNIERRPGAGERRRRRAGHVLRGRAQRASSPTRSSTPGTGARSPRAAWVRLGARARGRRARARRRGRRAHRAARPTGTAARRDPAGQRQEPRPHRRRGATTATCRTATSRSRRRCSDPVDLVIFPESSMDADPRTDPYLAQPPRGDRPAHARVGARQRGRRRAGARGAAGRAPRR